MKTSNYAKTKAMDVSKLVAISCGIPEWFKGQSYRYLAPSADALRLYKRRQMSPAEYDRIYRAKIERLNPQMVYDTISCMAGFDAVLLCWCKVTCETDFCHRRIAADWLGHKLGIIIPELGHEPDGFTEPEGHQKPFTTEKKGSGGQISFLEGLLLPSAVWPD